MSDSESRKIAVAPSREFEITLVSTPSTGYVWQLQKYSQDLQFLGDRYEQIQGPQAPGNPVSQVFTFRAPEQGNHEVAFVLKRVWEATPIESRTYIVEVAPR